MIWGDFKKWVEEQGVTDDMSIGFISVDKEPGEVEIFDRKVPDSDQPRKAFWIA